MSRTSSSCRSARLAAGGAGLRRGAGHGGVPALAVPGRDSVAPPELARDAPVVDVAHPRHVGVGPPLGDEAGPPLLHGGDGRAGQRLDLHVPLVGEERLEHRLAALAAAERQEVRLRPAVEPLLGQRGLDRLAGLEAIHSLERAGLGGHAPVRADDRQERQPVPLRNREVVEVVGRRDLHRAGPELRVHEHGVGDHRELPAGHRVAHVLPHHGAPAIVVGVHGDGGVAQHGLRAGGGHHDLAGSVGQRVGEAPQLPGVVLLVVHLEVGERGVAARAPVDELLGPVDEPLLPQPHEDLADRAGEPLVHGEALALPVEGGAQRLVLHPDAGAVLLLPCPDPAQELLAPQVVPALLLGPLQLLLHDHLGGDARVVGAGEPEHVEPAHALPADEDVLDGGGERVAEVQGAGDVGRRKDDGEGRPGPVVLVGVEVPALEPGAVPAGLDVGVVVGLRQLGRGRGLSFFGHLVLQTGAASFSASGARSPGVPRARG